MRGCARQHRQRDSVQPDTVSILRIKLQSFRSWGPLLVFVSPLANGSGVGRLLPTESPHIGRIVIKVPLVLAQRPKPTRVHDDLQGSTVGTIRKGCITRPVCTQ